MENKFKSDIVIKNRMFRWDIYYCSLDQDIANKNSCLIGKPNRPCLIVSPDEYNRRSSKILVMPFCSCNMEGLSPKQYVEQERKRGDVLVCMTLNRDEPSYLIVSQPRLIYKSMIQDYVGTLDPDINPTMAQRVEEEVFKFFVDEEVFLKSSYFKELLGKAGAIEREEENFRKEFFNFEEDKEEAKPEEEKKEEPVKEEAKEEVVEEEKQEPSDYQYLNLNLSMNQFAKSKCIDYFDACKMIADKEKEFEEAF